MVHKTWLISVRFGKFLDGLPILFANRCFESSSVAPKLLLIHPQNLLPSPTGFFFQGLFLFRSHQRLWFSMIHSLDDNCLETPAVFLSTLEHSRWSFGCPGLIFPFSFSLTIFFFPPSKAFCHVFNAFYTSNLYNCNLHGKTPNLQTWGGV